MNLNDIFITENEKGNYQEISLKNMALILILLGMKRVKSAQLKDGVLLIEKWSSWTYKIPER